MLSPPQFFILILYDDLLFDLLSPLISSWPPLCIPLLVPIPPPLITLFFSALPFFFFPLHLPSFCFLHHLRFFFHCRQLCPCFISSLPSDPSSPQVQSTSWMPHQQYVMQPTVCLWTRLSFWFCVCVCVCVCVCACVCVCVCVGGMSSFFPVESFSPFSDTFRYIPSCLSSLCVGISLCFTPCAILRMLISKTTKIVCIERHLKSSVSKVNVKWAATGFISTKLQSSIVETKGLICAVIFPFFFIIITNITANDGASQ